MVHKTEREILLGELENKIFAVRHFEINRNSESDSSDGSESDDAEVDEAEHLLAVKRKLKACRYLHPREPVPKSYHFICNVFGKLNEKRFRQDVRMSQAAFLDLVSRLSSHKIFISTPKKPQKPVELQLMVALYRFGCFGNGASIGKIARHFGIAEGSVVLYTNRMIVGLMSLETKTITWPDAEEKKVVKQRIASQSPFPNCLGFIDGTLVVFENKPLLEGADYFSHKNKYGLNTLIVCDDQRRIRYLFTGFCGSAHDNRIFANSKIGRFPERFFQGGEYLLADSGYTTSKHIVASYKKPAAELPENEAFNYQLSRIRMRVEHCNGMLKGRFQSLKGIRCVLNNVADHRKIVYWVRACAVLHNILIDDYYDRKWGTKDDCTTDLDEKETEYYDEPISEGKQKREFIKQIVLDAL